MSRIAQRPERWKGKIYWQKVGSLWHIDDATNSGLLTLCGKNYLAKDPDTNVEPKIVCDKCKKILVQYTLWLGPPELVENINVPE